MTDPSNLRASQLREAEAIRNAAVRVRYAYDNGQLTPGVGVMRTVEAAEKWAAVLEGPTDEMVEAVAKAIAEVRSSYSWKLFLPEARAALQAALAQIGERGEH